jgi:hypothetical protein
MKYLFCIFFLAVSFAALAQDKPVNPAPRSANFELGKGLTFSLNNGDYTFKLGGMMQPAASFIKDSIAEAEYFFNSRRTYFNIGGEAKNEKLEFFIQMDFSRPSPLLDAWVSYLPHKSTKITVGQKQTIANNREMLLMEDQLQFVDRSVLSNTFSQTGREFGVFVESKLNVGSFLLVPQIAATSGDGRNSFGTTSLDPDAGGLKYAARVDVYPFGAFKEENDKQVADLYYEESPKLVLGAAASYNDGASGSQGEGHNEVSLYNYLGQQQLPDYRQVYGDVLLKYKGFSFLGEYGIATAKGLEGAFVDETAAIHLIPAQISEILSLGTGMNLQMGYTTKSGYGADIRYASVTPEFDTNAASVVSNLNAATIGITKYVKQNSLKLNAAITSYDFNGTSQLRGDFMVQVVF